ncbi:MAG TPA: deoxyribonuclease IV [Candidatus Dojkabacteria bacterium]|nr:deoxyribonuclease IV [Candidatus Dojkabacteria bacterium]
MRYYGAHVTSAGGHENAIIQAEKYGINSIQIMPTAPMRWALKDIDIKQVENFVAKQKGSIVEKLLLHCVYLINLAREDKQMFHLGKMSLVTYLKYIEEITKRTTSEDLEVLGVTFHPGSAKDLTPEEGIKRITYGLNWILEQVPGKSMILLESSAGSGAIMGDTLEELAAMREGVEDKSRVGYVLDTQHMFVSGYDWRTDLEGIISKIEKTIGLENVKCFHLNDSLMDFESHKDRHADLGKGKIGLEAISAVINHPKLKNIPFILETPALKSEKTMGDEIKTLKNIVEE